jgi:hypothetical protein
MRYIFLSSLFFIISFSVQSQSFTSEYQYKAVEDDKLEIKTTLTAKVQKPFDIKNDKINPNVLIDSEKIDERISELKEKVQFEKSESLCLMYKKEIKTLKARKRTIKKLSI